MSKTIMMDLTQDQIRSAAKAARVTAVTCSKNPHRITLLDMGERVEAFTEGSDTTIYFFTSKRVGTNVYHPMPVIIEKMLSVLGLMEAHA